MGDGGELVTLCQLLPSTLHFSCVSEITVDYHWLPPNTRGSEIGGGTW